VNKDIKLSVVFIVIICGFVLIAEALYSVSVSIDSTVAYGFQTMAMCIGLDLIGTFILLFLIYLFSRR